MSTAIYFLLPVAYMLGTFPSAVLVARSKGIDITAVGSGNPGASNIARTLGAKLGIAVFVLDGSKGAIPAAVGLALHTRPGAYVLVGAAVLGHMFPITRRFVGGKGVSTMAGATLVLHPISFLILIVVWYVTRKASAKASLASLAIVVGLPIAVVIEGRPGWEVGATVALAALVMARHTSNIKRLLSGGELSASRG